MRMAFLTATRPERLLGARIAGVSKTTGDTEAKRLMRWFLGSFWDSAQLEIMVVITAHRLAKIL